MKTCSKCKQEKEEDCFRSHPENNSRKMSHCKQCENRRKTLRNKRLIAADPKVALISYAKRRARKLKLPFSIKAEDISLPAYCPVLGISLGRYSAAQHVSDSLDRINPADGYIKGNVQVMSHRANALKSDATPEELAAVLEKIHGWTCVPPSR